VRPKVDVIVLNWNGFGDTSACLSSLQELSYPNYRVIVVDNASTDDSPSRIRQQFPQIELIETDRNLGFGGGCNVGITRALAEGADFVWLLNNDTTVDSEALQSLVATAMSRPRIGAVGSAIYFSDEPGRLQAWGGGRVNFWLGRSRHFLQPVSDEKVQFITGASLLLPRAALESVGLFDVGFFMYWEDADYCFRLRRAGWRVAVAGESKVWHKAGPSRGQGSLSSYRYFNASASHFFEKHSPVPWFSFWAGFAPRLARRLLAGDWERARAVWAGLHQQGAAR
jgi:GT2 family glycosyltransferase